MIDSQSKFIAVLYCNLVITITADFTMNLILAVFIEAFKKEVNIYEENKLKELEEEKKRREEIERLKSL